jgi:uncharacterized protein
MWARATVFHTVSDTTAPLPFGLSRETRIRIDREGRFFHEDDLIVHEALWHSLASWVDVDPESGRYILKNNINWAFVTVDDTPLVVKRYFPDDAHVLVTDGTSEPLDLATLTLDASDVPYCRVRGGKLPARFSRQAAYSLLENARIDPDGSVYLGERKIPRGGPVHPTAAATAPAR